ncbi:hypothetical protein BDB01DRAFT_846685 [Pilobolus umbonatus]|nr:hypothetical protein BDB01DRAFT_846685 [Pilobolus umbonatus]
MLKPSDIASILDTIDGIVGLNRDVEISMEANSTSCESSKLVGFKEAGINRLSLGIQALNDVDLKVLGRDHSANEALDALSRAKTVFRPERVSCDLIYARPGQSLEDWRKELTTALSIAGDHISIYQLTIERSTPIDKQLRKGLIPPVPEGDIIADMHEETIRIATEFGYHHYEVSNYAKNQQAIGRHNFSYWQGMDYLGIGPGSHGRLTDQTTNRRIRTFGEFHPNKYMSLCENEGEGIRKLAPIPIQEMAEELIVFGMRTRMGITRARFTTMTQGLSLEQYINKDALKLFVDSKLLIDESGFSGNHAFVPAELMSEWEGGGIRPTEAGLQRIDYILPRLFEL